MGSITSAIADRENDPHGIEQHTKGAKLDDGKPDMSLLLDYGLALTAVARVGTQGALKYTRGGWQFVPQGVLRYTAALLRHLFKERYEFGDGEIEAGHAAQDAWNALARLELLERRRLGIRPEDLRDWTAGEIDE